MTSSSLSAAKDPEPNEEETLAPISASEMGGRVDQAEGGAAEVKDGEVEDTTGARNLENEGGDAEAGSVSGNEEQGVDLATCQSPESEAEAPGPAEETLTSVTSASEAVVAGSKDNEGDVEVGSHPSIETTGKHSENPVSIEPTEPGGPEKEASLFEQEEQEVAELSSSPPNKAKAENEPAGEQLNHRFNPNAPVSHLKPSGPQVPMPAWLQQNGGHRIWDNPPSSARDGFANQVA